MLPVSCNCHVKFEFFFQISVANTYLPLIIHDASPVSVKILLKSVPSCENSNIVVFTSSSMRECQLTNNAMENGTTACVYRCEDSCSSKVTIKFEKPWDRPPRWSLCEVIPI